MKSFSLFISGIRTEAKGELVENVEKKNKNRFHLDSLIIQSKFSVHK